MSTSPLQSAISKAREQFENGHAKACVETLKGVVEDLKVGEPEWYRLRNDVTLYLGKFNSLERERGFGVLSQEMYMLEWNKLQNGSHQLLLDFDGAVKESIANQAVELINGDTYPVELILDLPYEETKLEEINLRVTNIEKILKTHFGLSERITGVDSGSVVVKMDLYAEEILKIKSLVKLGLVDKVLSFEVRNVAWDWIEKEKFVLWLRGVDLSWVKLNGTNLVGANFGEANLVGVDFSGANLVGANFSEANLNGADLNGADLFKANLSRADLSGADLSKAHLSEANLIGTYLIGANLIGANLISANLIGANFIGASLNGADLSGADLSKAHLSGVDLSIADLVGANLSDAQLIGANLICADLSGANLHGTYLDGVDLSEADLIGAHLIGAYLSDAIFHVNQLEMLEEMNIDMSEVIFVDDEQRSVEILVEIE